MRMIFPSSQTRMAMRLSLSLTFIPVHCSGTEEKCGPDYPSCFAKAFYSYTIIQELEIYFEFLDARIASMKFSMYNEMRITISG